MTTPVRPHVQLTDPAQLIAAVPYLLGFHPAHSVVLVAVHGRSLGLTLRADLPARRDEPELALRLVEPLLRHAPDHVVLLVIGGGTAHTGARPPQHGFVDRLTEVLTGLGVPVSHAVWTDACRDGAPWRCYDDDGCAGTLPDPESTALAAATVAAGAVTHTDRDAVAALLDPDPAATDPRRVALIAEHDRDHPYDDRAVRRGVALVRDAVGAAVDADPVLDDECTARIGSALTDHRVRDACLLWCLADDTGPVRALWTALTRVIPAPHRAEPAVLLAASAYLGGDGALAGIALDVALDAHPEHSLGALLRVALDGGVTPDQLRGVLHDSAADVMRVLDVGDERSGASTSGDLSAETG